RFTRQRRPELLGACTKEDRVLLDEIECEQAEHEREKQS
ncbi:MAG: hypothetical protein QG656_2295, partial [Candidatus Hydrogenedentes bacterium]|nr:hypothetical protein [Candidatus Hydrogenedentota bacterium]